MSLLERKSPSGSDYYQTPIYATEMLLPYLSPGWVVWEPASGKDAIVRVIKPHVKRVIANDILNGFDFLKDPPPEFDCIVTNPPFSKKDEFLERCYGFGKPFALLMPLTALEGLKRHEWYREHGVQLLIPNRRVNFIHFDGTLTNSCWFPIAWFTWGILKRDLTFIEMERT